MKLSNTEIINQCKTILEGMKLESATNAGVFDVDTKSVVYGEWIESFDNGENIDALRSPSDLYTTQIEGVSVDIGRVNCWLIDEDLLSQRQIPITDRRGVFSPNEARGKAIIQRTFRLFFFYQYGGGGTPFVRKITERAIELFNQLPKLGFAPAKAQFIEGQHEGLQIPLMTEGDFKGTICYVRGCRLTMRTIEPL